MADKYTKLERRQITRYGNNGVAESVAQGFVRYKIEKRKDIDGNDVEVLADKPEILPEDIEILREEKKAIRARLVALEERITLITQAKIEEAQAALDTLKVKEAEAATETALGE